MPRRAATSDRGMGEWVKSFGEQLGAELGRVIAASLQRTLLSSIDVADLARRAGGGGRRGRRAAGQKALCSEPGCPNPVLAKGLCRSHYYRARYRAQKGGGRGRRGKGEGGAGKRRRGRRPKATAEAPAATETAAG